MYVILILLLVWNKFVIIIILNIATTATIHCYIDIYIGRVADKDVDRAGDESGRSFLDRLKIKAVTLSQKRDWVWLGSGRLFWRTEIRDWPLCSIPKKNKGINNAL